MLSAGLLLLLLLLLLLHAKLLLGDIPLGIVWTLRIEHIYAPWPNFDQLTNCRGIIPRAMVELVSPCCKATNFPAGASDERARTSVERAFAVHAAHTRAGWAAKARSTLACARQMHQLENRPLFSLKYKALSMPGCPCAQQQVSLLADLWSKTKRIIAASLAVKEAETQVAALRQVTRERKEELRIKKADMETWAARVQKAREIFERSKAQALREYPRNEEVDAQCADLSDDQAELQDLQTQKTAEAQLSMALLLIFGTRASLGSIYVAPDHSLTRTLGNLDVEPELKRDSCPLAAWAAF
eukprot:1158902-Pelagomonas_calceolata.AAC.2